jgi:uncharacterized protein (UPF0248 family)
MFCATDCDAVSNKGHPTTPSCLHVYTLHVVNKFLHNSGGARPRKCTSIYVVYLAANKKRNMDDMDSKSNFYVLSFSVQGSTRICIHTGGTSYMSKSRDQKLPEHESLAGRNMTTQYANEHYIFTVWFLACVMWTYTWHIYIYIYIYIDYAPYTTYQTIPYNIKRGHQVFALVLKKRRLPQYRIQELDNSAYPHAR